MGGPEDNAEAADTHWVTTHTEGVLGVITLNRPERRNALTTGMLQQLRTAANTLSDDEALRAIVLEATGDTFSVGADLDQAAETAGNDSLLRRRRGAELGGALLRTLRDIHQPTVCALQGIATGGAACIAAACDFRVCSDSAKMGLGEVRMGMNLMWQAMPYFVDLLGTARAKQFIMSGRLFPATTLSEWGLVDALCPSEELADTARNWAMEYASLPPVAVQMIKRSVNRYAQALAEPTMHMDHDQWLLTAQSEDFRECISAFKEKRPPDTQGR